MEKLSSIIPSNSRLKSVDMEDAHPVRPGVPSLGRPIGMTSSQRDRLSISSTAKEAAFNETLAKRNPREDQSVKIVEQVTDNFFKTRLSPKEEIGLPMTLSEQVANVEVTTPTAQYIATGAVTESSAESGQLIDKQA